jgi:CBS domain-containing protein
MNPGDIPVSTLVANNVAGVSPEATLSQVARTLDEADVGLVVVRANSHARPIGVVSERDLTRALAEGQDLATTTAGDVAHTELVWSDTTATVAEVAREMMERYIRHVLVEKNGRLVGIVSARDLLGVYAAADLVDFDIEG